MQRQAAVWTALVALAACTLAGCSKPPYLVPGLTLPPGAIHVQRIPRTFPASTPSGSVTKGETISVLFDCPGDWVRVSDHIDRCMRRAGIPDITQKVQSQLNQNSSGDEEGLEELNPILQELPESGKTPSGNTTWNFRYYQKPLKFNVYLLDMDSMVGKDPARVPPGLSFSATGTHAYVLGVTAYYK